MCADTTKCVNVRISLLEKESSTTLLSALIAERGTEMMKTLQRPESFSKNIFKTFVSQILKKEDAMLLTTGFATVSHIANHCQIPCCIMKFCYS